LNPEDVKRLLDARTADLQRLVAISKRLQAGKKASNADTTWIHEALAADAGPSGLASAPVPSQVLVAFFGTTRRTLTTYVNDGMPKVGRNQYLVPDCVAWLVKRKVNESRKARGRSDPRDRIDKATATLKEMEVKREKGLIIDRDLAQRSVDSCVNEAKSLLETLWPRLSTGIGPEGQHDKAELEEIVEKLKDLALEALARGRWTDDGEED